MRKSKRASYTRFQKLRKKHYRDIMSISSISTQINDSFDKVYAAASISIKNEISDSRIIAEGLSEKVNQIKFEEDIDPSEKDLELFNYLGSTYWTITSNEDALFSLSEMRILFLFKTIENAIKEIISIAYPKTEKRDLFRWQSITNHLKNNGIKISNLAGYNEVNQLRIVNNNIKHSQQINEETKKISFWNDKDEFNYEDLEKFYTQIKALAIAFMEELGQTIINNCYILSDKKLEEMAKQIFEKLEEKQTKKLIGYLEQQE